jgi:hypothetical protein
MNPAITPFLLSALALVSYTTLAQQTNSSSGEVHITERVLTEFKGWGLVPSWYDRAPALYGTGTPAAGEGSWLPKAGAEPLLVHRMLGGIGFDYFRLPVSPLTSAREGALDEARLQDLRDNLTILQKVSPQARYILTVWSPPAYMKLPDHVRWGKQEDRLQHLDPAFADGQGWDFADFFVDIAKHLRAHGFPAPAAIIPQNEPGTARTYDSCLWTKTAEQQQAWRNTVKLLRTKLDAAGFKDALVLGPDTEGSHTEAITTLLGDFSNGKFSALEQDPALREALGGFSFHQYSTSERIDSFRTALHAYPGKDVWMTEYSKWLGIRGELREKCSNFELASALDTVRRMGSDFVDFRVTRWFYWRGWHVSSAADDEHLLYGPKERPQMTKLGRVFEQLCHTVRPGWRVKATISTVPDLRADNEPIIAKHTANGNMMSVPVDVFAFDNAGGTASCVVLANWKATQRAVSTLTGLKGARATPFVTDNTRDMAAETARTITSGKLDGDDLVLPPHSITLLVASPKTHQ